MNELQIAFEAIRIYQTQYTQVDKLWGYFSVVTLAMAGFVIGNDQVTEHFWVTMVIVIAYLVFCIGNHQALITGQKQLEEFAIIAKNCAQKAQLDISSINPIPHKQIRTFHLSTIAVVSLGVIIIGYFIALKG